MAAKRPHSSTAMEGGDGHVPHKRTSFDYSLPTQVNDKLTLPIEEVVRQCLPDSAAHPAMTQLSGRFKAAIDLNANTRSTSSPLNPKSHPFVNAMNKLPDVRTENGAFAYSTTNSALLDLFDDFKPGVHPPVLFKGLEAAWNVDPEMTLRIIFHARSIHEGKGFKEGFYRAMAWLYENHFLTLLINLHMITDLTCIRHRSTKRDKAKVEKDVATKLEEDLGVAELDEDGEMIIEVNCQAEYPPRPHGCFKDLMDMLMLVLHDQFSTSFTKALTALNESLAPASQAAIFKKARLEPLTGTVAAKKKREAYHHLLMASTGRNIPKQMRVPVDVNSEEAAMNAPDLKTQMVTGGAKRQKHEILRGRLLERFQKDAKFTVFYIAAVDLFVKTIREDLVHLEKHQAFVKLPEAERGVFKGKSSPHLFGMTYAAKWVPTPAHGADRQLFFASAIATRLFPEMDRVNVNAARERLQRSVLSPLRAALRVPETKMGQGVWHVDYTKVPSRAMNRNAANFLEHDPVGYDKYLTAVATGMKTISGASLMPHEPIFDATSNVPVRRRLGDLQWNALVDSIASSSDVKLSNCLAIADVSGSMGSFSGSKKDPSPLVVCIALTLLLGELSESPWNGSFFTFSEDPKWEKIDPSLELSKRVETLHQADWGGATNFYKVFELILDVAQTHQLTKDQMIKKLFCFSDMQFDQAAAHGSEYHLNNAGTYGVTEYQRIKARFESAGYEMPEMVFWNLSAREEDDDQPTNKVVQHDERGVAMMSGFSGALMKYFLQGASGPLTPGTESPAAEAKTKDSSAGSTKKDGGVTTQMNAHEHMMAILDKACFEGLQVVD
ncbi:hypothetical protein BD324DRAFT_619219 [Kockovaella imperatae]|uniref:Uncharacterized protein n=1 Tax=Kockovaella imperatae TaxID=4999 RepID=A0A1Y1UMR9_9TREE|nr:hypothetical protein BD324DRAFT_619219 [Kockovaella imperatae]ORX39309.1 hypothetical protein BD324DRAFT_619219 [Kockovaella imperatae]